MIQVLGEGTKKQSARLERREGSSRPGHTIEKYIWQLPKIVSPSHSAAN
jgi:hypothetical protein